MNPANILAVAVLVIGVPLNLTVAVMLWRRYRAAPHIRVLRERLIAELAVLLVVVVFSFVFLNNDTFPPPFDTDFTKLVTRLTVLVMAVVPAVYWLTIYRIRR